MESLDLTIQPPSSPYQKMNGLYMMPRTIDKMRAQLSGGKTGAYSITTPFGPGLSILLLEGIGVTEEHLLQRIGEVSAEDEIADWLRKHADLSSVADINERLRSQRIESCSILAADSKGAFLASPISFDLVLCVLQFRKDLFTPLQEHLAGRRQFHVSPASHEKLGAELVLQSLDALAQRRLRNIQQRRSPPKMRVFATVRKYRSLIRSSV